MSEAERSEWYWTSVTDFGAYGLTYDSLRDITAAAHLVVRGRVVDMRDGEVWPFGLDVQQEDGPWRTTFGVVEVREVLKGVAETTTPDTIRVAEIVPIGAVNADLPSGEVILFLMNYAKLRADVGMPPSPDPEDGYYYTRPNGYQCVVRDVDGMTRIVEGPRDWETHFGPFPAQLDGQSFEDLAGRIRDLAGAA
jgi:hypothetical protein